MSRLAIFLVVAVAALTQASIQPDAVKVALLNQNGVSVDESAAMVQSNVKSNALCKDCEKVVTALKKIVDNPQTEQELENTLKAVCDYPLFASFKQRCLNLVNNVVVVLHEVQGVLDDPTALCKTIKFCNGESPSFSSFSKRLSLSVASKVLQDIHEPANFKIDTCEICQSALNELKRILETPEVLTKIQSGIEQVCKYAGKYQTDCNELVEYLFPKLIQAIQDALCQPQQACSAIKLCKSTTAATFETFTSRLTAFRQQTRVNNFLTRITTMQTARGINIGCLACETAVKTALKELTQPSVEKTIATDITNLVCKLLPKTMRPSCFDFLGIYGVPTLQLTFSEVTPKELCQDIHACTASFLEQINAMPINEKSVAVCDACKMLSKVLSFELQQPSFQQDIISVLTRGCKLIPGDISNKCGNLVIQSVPAGLSYAADFLTRDDACAVVRLC